MYIKVFENQHVFLMHHCNRYYYISIPATVRVKPKIKVTVQVCIKDTHFYYLMLKHSFMESMKEDK